MRLRLCGTSESWWSNSIVKGRSAGAARQSLSNFLSLAAIESAVPDGLQDEAGSAAATAGMNAQITRKNCQWSFHAAKTAYPSEL